MDDTTAAYPVRSGPEVQGNIKGVDNKGSQPVKLMSSKETGSSQTLENPHTVNMRQSGDIEIHGQATVYGEATVYGPATVYGQATVYGPTTVYGSATVYGQGTVYGPAMLENQEQPRSVLKETLHPGNDQADLLIGLYELPHSLQEMFTPYLKDERFRDKVVKQFGQLRSNAQLRRESAQEFLSLLGSFLRENDPRAGTADAVNPMTGVTGLPELLQEAMVPYLKDERFKVEIMERLGGLRNNPQRQQRVVSGLLDVLELEDEEGSHGQSSAKDFGQGGHLPTSAFIDPTGGLVPKGKDQLAAGDDARIDHHLAVDDTPPVEPLDSHEKFFDWTTFKSHQLEPKQDVLENKHLVTLALYDSVKVNVGVQGFSIGLEGFAKLIRSWLHKEDLLAFYRSLPREILLPMSDGDENVDRQRLEKLEIKLFDTSKFNGSDRRLTSVTYGNSKYGTITLFELKKADDGTPKTIRPKAAMRGVPKIILKKMAEGIKGGSKTTLTMPHHKIWEVTEQIKEDTPLGRVITTVPQMIAMLHHKTELIENIESTDVRSTVNEGGGLPWVRMLDGPELNGHSQHGAGFYVVVLGPAKGRWLEERLAWK